MTQHPLVVDLASRGQRPYAGTGMNSFFIPSPAGLAYHSIRYGDGVWIALAVNGVGNQVSKSVNGGLSWTQRAEPGARQWTGLCYCGAHRWVAVAQNGVAAGQAMYSTDHGETWAAATMPAAIGWQDVAYGNGVCVAVANTGLVNQQVARSLDGGQNWVLAAGGAALVNPWNAVEFGNGVFIALSYGGAGNQIMWSNDGGDNWNAVAAPAALNWDGLRYNRKGRWVGCAFSSVPNNVMYSDDDGQSWTQGLLAGNTSDWVEVAFGNDSWCAVAGNIGRLGYSKDGIAFRNIPYVDNTSMYSIDYGADRFIASGNTYFQIS